MWDSLHEAILLDLERQLGRKISNAHLFNCLAYDFLFVQLVIGPCFVTAWRGTWRNADSLFDDVLCQGNLVDGSILAIVLGVFMSALIFYFQHEARAFAQSGSKFKFFFASRIFTTVRFYFDLTMWKGIWGLFSSIIGASWYLSLSCFTGGSFILLLTRTLKTALCTPMGNGIDRPKTYFAVPTYMSSDLSDSTRGRILDICFTIPINLVAITAFYGVWTGMDFIFQPTDTFPHGLARNGAICALLGFACGLLVFILQLPVVWSHYKKKLVSKPLEIGPMAKFARLLGYDMILLISLIGNVASFRGIWNILDAYFIPDDFFMSTLTCQFVGLFYCFLFFAGTSLHGGVRRDSQCVLIPNLFFTYLMSE